LNTIKHVFVLPKVHCACIAQSIQTKDALTRAMMLLAIQACGNTIRMQWATTHDCNQSEVDSIAK
ncbi:MAG: hypothetical protein ACKPKO_16930, partial [Candidatus Fonsibacter sp.]